MKHTFNLVSPGKETSPVRLIVSHNGEKFRHSVGISVRTSLWNQKARTVDKMCKDRRVWEVVGTVHAKLVEREVTARSRRDVTAAIAYALGKDLESPTQRPSFWPYFKEWAERDTPSRRFRELAYRRVSAMMGTDDDWEDIDGDWYFRFIQKCNELGFSHNYKSTLTAKVKTCLKEGMDRGFHRNDAYRKFATSYMTAHTIALIQEEVDALWDADLYGREADARDVFVVGVYCAGRFQDYSVLSVDNVSKDGMLRYVQRKTGASVVIPCSPRIKEVFARHGGRCPSITEQEVGRHIKEVCRKIGGSFDEMVEVRVSKGTKTIVEKKHRYEMVSCHTARRTGASLLYKSGIPVRVCRFLTGHTTDNMFLKYVKISKEEGADILAGSEFFR